MKKFILKTFAFIILFLSAGIYFNTIPKLKFYGNQLSDKKVHFFSKNSQNYNTIFLGSSRVYRHLDPKIVDSVSDGKINSFNFGLPGVNFLEIEMILDYLDYKNLDYVVLELMPLQNEAEINIDSKQSLYYRTIKNTKLIAEHNIQNKEFKQLSKNLIAYFKNILYFPKLNSLQYDLFMQPKKGFTGFQALDEKIDFDKDRQDFLNNPTIVEKRIQDNKKLRTKYFEGSVTVSEIIKINNDLKHQGAKLILFVPPINFNTVDLKVFEKYEIPVINTYSPSEYKNLYKEENIFDIGHLNKGGAKILSESFGKKLNKITNQ